MNFSPEETNSTSSPTIALKNQNSSIIFPTIPPIITNSINKEEKKTDFNIINSINNNNIINQNSTNIIYNTGRWSKEEHLKFINGILEYGNEWKKVQNLIGTRSSTQARSHAQKFFLRLKKNFNLDNNNDLSECYSTSISPVSNSKNINNENGIYMKNFFELIYKNKKDKKIKNEKLTLEQKKKIINLVSKISLHENNENSNIKNNNENNKKNDLNVDFNKSSMIKIKINDENDYKIIDNNNNNEKIENKMNENKKIFEIKKEKNKKNLFKKNEKKMSFDYNYHYENLIKSDNFNKEDDDLCALGKKRKKNNNNDFHNNNNENINFFNRHRYNSVEVNSNYLSLNLFDEKKNNPFDINFSIDNFNNYNNNNININNNIINNNHLIIEEENITSISNNNLINNNHFDNFKI